MLQIELLFLCMFACQLAGGLDLLQNTNICSTGTCITGGNFRVGFLMQNDSGSPTVTFQLEHPIGSASNPYIAVGFSPDGSMATASVTACVYTNPSVQVILTYNPGYSNKRISTPSLESTVITNTAGGVINGTLVCKWTQLAKSPSGLNVQYDLTSNSYALIFAYGSSQQGSLVLTQHTERVSGSAVNFTTGDQSAGVAQICADQPMLQKAHGICMLFAWCVFIPIAILFARYFKRIWPDHQPMKIKLWFHFHRGSNTLGIVLTIIALILILVSVCGQWVGNDDWYRKVHTGCGIASVIIALAQPIIAAFRCGIDDKKRPIFNWIHRVLGLTGFCCACATIWFARFLGMGILQHGPLMIFYFVIIVLTAIGLELHLWYTEVRKKKTDAAIPMANDNLSTNNQQNRYSVTWAYARSATLGLFAVCAVGVSIALSVAIAKSDGSDVVIA